MAWGNARTPLRRTAAKDFSDVIDDADDWVKGKGFPTSDSGGPILAGNSAAPLSLAGAASQEMLNPLVTPGMEGRFYRASGQLCKQIQGVA